MDFQPVKASDKEIIDKYMKKANSRSCDMSFACSISVERLLFIRVYSV